MLLRRMELMGFKSFADKTVIEFGPGISSIVGPNGSGKSNVVDAVRWVLGEASARTLRGQRMEDVIFAGSTARRPVPLAEVTLTLDNADGALPLPFAEVNVTRRVDRSAVGEYMINRQPCRLRDVQELFAGTGLGRRSFALLGQGEVEEALRARPVDRRAMVEEAAGISRFQLKLQEGKKRLQFAGQHMDRLGDILRERERALEDLARQAERVVRHTRLTDELRATELALLAQQWGAAEEQRAAVGTRAAEAGARVQELLEGLTTTGAQLRQAQSLLEQARTERATRVGAAQELAASLRQARQAADVAERLRSAAEEQARRAEASGEHLSRRRAALEGELAAAEAAAQQAAARQQSAREAVDEGTRQQDGQAAARQRAAEARSRVQEELASCL